MLGRAKELELKLEAPADFLIPDLEGAGVASSVEQEPQELSAFYFDTPDFRLLKSKITLRRRSGEGPAPVWTLKLPTRKDDAERTEMSFPANSEHPPESVTTLLTGVCQGEPLKTIAEIKTKRRPRLLVSIDGAELAHLVDDRVVVLHGNNIATAFREIEIEAISADRDDLERIARVIEDAGARPDQRSKLSRATEALYGIRAEKPQRPGPDDSTGDAARSMLRDALSRLLASDPYARLQDAEGVHQMRVGARRLRSVLRMFSAFIPEGKTHQTIEGLRWLGQALGRARDLDVLTSALERQDCDRHTAAPIFATLAARRSEAYDEVQRDISSDRYIKLIQNVEALILDESLLPDDPGPNGEVLPDLVDKGWHKMRSAAKDLTLESPAEEFHRVRLLGKRARYVAESADEFTNSKENKRIGRLAIEAEAVQNTLGEQQDAFFARDTLLEIASQHPTDAPLNFLLGRLVEREEQRARRCAEGFFEIRQKLKK